MEHWDYGSYDDGYAKGRADAQVDKNLGKIAGSFASMFAACFVTLLVAFHFILVNSAALLSAYLFFRRAVMGAGEKILFVITTAYLIICLLCYLKGLLIAAKARKHYLWIFLFAICVLFACGVPTMAVYDIAVDWMGKEAPHVRLYSGICAAFTAAYIYWRFNFLKDSTTFVTRWVYRLGVKNGHRWFLKK